MIPGEFGKPVFLGVSGEKPVTVPGLFRSRPFRNHLRGRQFGRRIDDQAGFLLRQRRNSSGRQLDAVQMPGTIFHVQHELLVGSNQIRFVFAENASQDIQRHLVQNAFVDGHHLFVVDHSPDRTAEIILSVLLCDTHGTFSFLGFGFLENGLYRLPVK